jgi:hypothetical protein
MIHFFGKYKDPAATVFARNVATDACELWFSYAGHEGPSGLFFSIVPGDFVQSGDTRTVVDERIAWTFVVTRK